MHIHWGILSRSEDGKRRDLEASDQFEAPYDESSDGISSWQNLIAAMTQPFPYPFWTYHHDNAGLLQRGCGFLSVGRLDLIHGTLSIE